MIPIDFDGSNALLSGPPGSDIQPLHCFRAHIALRDPEDPKAAPVPTGSVMTISRWKLTAEEVAELLKTKTVWLCVMSPREAAMNPAYITGTRPAELPPLAPATEAHP
ncbi:MAG: hypothetical protein ACKVZJ_14780 [Phycisphaerales bacterium]